MATRIRRKRRRPHKTRWHRIAIPIVFVIGILLAAGGVAAAWAIKIYNEAPPLASKVARGKRMTKTRKTIAGVSLRLAHAGSSAALKSDPAALALVDEYDEMLSNIKGQGDPLGLIERRGDTYPDFVCVVTSTCKRGMVQPVHPG